jgi:putative oxidoreductase
MKDYTALAGRISLALIFIMSGIGKITDFEDTRAYMSAYGMPLTWFLAIGAIALELGGGISLIAGFLTHLGALALIVFLIPTTLIFHTDFADKLQVIMFMKNLAIIGGLLMVFSFGAGKISVDEVLSKRK